MKDLRGQLAGLRRPQLLVATAQRGAAHYDRLRDLPRLIGTAPGAGPAMAALFAIEDALEDARRLRAPDYRAARHLATLTALIGEARLLERADAIT